ncbi:MAG: TIGR03936 family radical SAM-associated protein [Candidatus Aureabacteria bacterium]|nr:TIGR03936 family radical SAM-associated protein [Candidatus Auribacterota bacterium]
METQEYRYRIIYEKKGAVRFVSHLDLGRIFMRALRASGINLKFSQGYNPHPRVSFCPPLSLGFEGICEYMDFETVEELDYGPAVASVNDHLPSGIRVNQIEKVERKAQQPLSSRYVVKMVGEEKFIRKSIEIFLKMGDCRLQVKPGGKVVDIKKSVKSLSFIEENGEILLDMEISLSQGEYINPRRLVGHIFNKCERDVLNLVISRQEIIYGEKNV